MKTLLTTDISLCSRLLSSGELVAIPTETVYGLAANIFCERALKNIFSIKDRPADNPLIVHLHDIEQVDELCHNIPNAAYQLMEAFWPGPLSLVLPKSNVVNSIVSGGLNTVALRIPDHPVTLALLRDLKKPLAAPSANPFTRISPTRPTQVMRYFDGVIPAILDGGFCEVGLESTIVGFDSQGATILRNGGVTNEAIKQVIGSVNTVSKKKPRIAPGMYAKHYAPKTPLIISDDPLKETEQYADKKIGLIVFSLAKPQKVSFFFSLSPKGSFEEAARKLYQALFEMDSAGVDLIIAERLPRIGLGRAINDRLERAQSKWTLVDLRFNC